MAILGDNTTPTSGTWFDTTTNKEFWTTNQYTMPAGGGIASNIFAYMGGHGGSVTMRFVVWDSVGNIFWQSGDIIVTSTVQWKNTTTINGIYLPAGNYVLGFWSSGAVDWVFEGVGGATGRSGLASPGTATGGSDEYVGGGFGRLGAYVDYTPGSIARLRRSSAWTGGIPVQERRSSAWTGGGPLVQERRGGIWVPTT